MFQIQYDNTSIAISNNHSVMEYILIYLDGFLFWRSFHVLRYTLLVLQQTTITTIKEKPRCYFFYLQFNSETFYKA